MPKELKTRYRFLNMQRHEVDSDIWQILNNKSNKLLGTIVYHKNARQSTFGTVDCAIFSTDELNEVADFMKQL